MNSSLTLTETNLLRALSNLLCKDNSTAETLSIIYEVSTIKSNRIKNIFYYVVFELDNSSFIYSPTSVLEIINKIQDPEIKTFMQTTWDNYYGANKIS